MKRLSIIGFIILAFAMISAIGTTDISVSAVKTELGSISNNVGVLCTDAIQNRWSKGRPAYLFIQGDSLYSKIPDGITTDPRGSYSGQTIEYYNLGDFKSYNHSATEPNLTTISDQTWTSDDAGLVKSRTINFNIGEWDYDDKNSDHSTLNDLTSFTNYHILVDGVSVADSNTTALADNTLVGISIDYTLGAEGSTTAYVVDMAIGNSATWVARIGNAFNAIGRRVFTATVPVSPQFTTPDVTGVTGATFVTKSTSGVRLGTSVTCDLTIEEAEKVVTITIYDGATKIGELVGESLTPTSSSIVISVSPALEDGKTYDTIVVDFP